MGATRLFARLLQTDGATRYRWNAICVLRYHTWVAFVSYLCDRPVLSGADRAPELVNLSKL